MIDDLKSAQKHVGDHEALSLVTVAPRTCGCWHGSLADRNMNSVIALIRTTS